jgi:hypothetical protein
VSILLDHGPHTVTVFMEEEVTDSRGNSVRKPAVTGVVVTGCLVIPIASTRGAFPAMDVRFGQRVDGAWRLFARTAPLGWWSRIEWAATGGAPTELIKFTVLGGPLYHGASGATRHLSATLQEDR